MTKNEMIEKFICPGCVGGMDINCGKFDFKINGCASHVIGTCFMVTGSFALGLPKGFNRAGFYPHAKEMSDNHNKMYIACFTRGEVDSTRWDNLNIPVWAMVQNGFLFLRVYSPRINETRIEVIEGGTLEMVPQAINVGEFYNEID